MGEFPVDSTVKEQSGQECLVGMESVHKQSMATSHNFSPQAVGWEQLHNPDAGSTGASFRGQVASLGVFGGLFLFAGAGGRWEWDGFQVKSDHWGTLRSSCREVHQCRF